VQPVPGTAADRDDMRRMHKTPELNVSFEIRAGQKGLLGTTNISKRIYSPLTLIGYAVIVGLTWPFVLV
jgi:hypothetical protein